MPDAHGKSHAGLSRELFVEDAPSKYVTVKPFVAGTFTLPERSFVSPVDPDAKRLVPSLCFLIEHEDDEGHSRCTLFDLGVRGKPDSYTPEIQDHLKNRQPAYYNAASDVLTRNGVASNSIDTVIISHVHWDHHGDPSDYPQATFYVGHGALDVLKNGLPGRGSHSHFDSALFDQVNVVELTEPGPESNAFPGGSRATGNLGVYTAKSKWQSFPPFVAALDLFQDGSAYVVPAPGHLPGHVNLLCHLGDRKWMYLAGDSFHDERLLTGEKDIAVWEDSGQRFCIHMDKEAAEKHIARIRELMRLCSEADIDLEIVASHDCNWSAANKQRCLHA